MIPARLGCSLALLALAHLAPVAAQTPEDFERARAMLLSMKRDLERYYYDTTFHGLNLEQRYRDYDSRLHTAGSRGELVNMLAQFLLDLDDSHTTFDPPSYSARITYGWTPRVIGDSVYVVRVDTTSDAWARGLRPGDLIVGIDGVRPNRALMWRIAYTYNRLAPRQTTLLTVRSPEGQQRNLYVRTRVSRSNQRVDLNDPAQRLVFFEELERSVTPHQTVEVGDSVLVWRMPQFYAGDEGAIDRIVARARSRGVLILDLRGNPGGVETTQLHLSSVLFDTPQEVMTIKRRSESRTLRTRRVERPFRGTLVILIDSESASSSEIVTRLCQLRGRATVVGDRSAGATMRSRYYVRRVEGATSDVLFGLSITDADVIMPDSQRLEVRGVTPDVVVLPTAADIAAKRDPQLARALELVGVRITAEEAGRLYRETERR